MITWLLFAPLFNAVATSNFEVRCKKLPLDDIDEFQKKRQHDSDFNDLIDYCVKYRAKKWPTTPRAMPSNKENLPDLHVETVIDQKDKLRVTIEDQNAKEDDVEIELDLKQRKIIFDKVYPNDSEYKSEHFFQKMIREYQEKFLKLTNGGTFAIEFLVANGMSQHLKSRLFVNDGNKDANEEILKAMPNLVQTQNSVLALNKELDTDFYLDLESITFGSNDRFGQYQVRINVVGKSSLSDSETTDPDSDGSLSDDGSSLSDVPRKK